MNTLIDKQYIEALKQQFHQQRYDDKDFSYQYQANEFMAWFREVILPTINQ